MEVQWRDAKTIGVCASGIEREERMSMSHKLVRFQLIFRS